MIGQILFVVIGIAVVLTINSVVLQSIREMKEQIRRF